MASPRTEGPGTEFPRGTGMPGTRASGIGGSGTGAPGNKAPGNEAPEAFSRPAPPGNGRTSGDPDDEPSPTDAFKQATARVGELKEYATYFVGAKMDGIKATLRSVVLYAALGIVGAVVGMTVLITSTVLLLTGLANAIGAIFRPDRPWAGALIVGVLVVAGAFVGTTLLMKSITGSSRKRTIEKYENRKRDERSVYGHDVADRAREQVREDLRKAGS